MIPMVYTILFRGSFDTVTTSYKSIEEAVTLYPLKSRGVWWIEIVMM